jgi:hypothetical protein
LYADPDPDPAAQINADPCGSGSGSETLFTTYSIWLHILRGTEKKFGNPNFILKRNIPSNLKIGSITETDISKIIPYLFCTMHLHRLEEGRSIDKDVILVVHQPFWFPREKLTVVPKTSWEAFIQEIKYIDQDYFLKVGRELLIVC